MAEINGSEILLRIGADSVGYQLSLSESLSNDLIDVTVKQDDFKHDLYGEQSITLSFEGCYVPSDTAQAALEAAARDQSEITAYWVYGASVFSAAAKIPSFNRAAPKNDKVTISVELKLQEKWTAV